VVFLIAELSIMMTGIRYYNNFEKNFNANVENQLGIIAKLKVREIEHWLLELRSDAATLYNNEAFSDIVKRYFKKPDDSKTKREIYARLRKFQDGSNYEAVILTDPELIKKIVIPNANEWPQAYISPGNIDSLRKNRMVFEDFYTDESKQKIFLKILIPVLDVRLLIGIIELRIDPQTYLYPVLASSPISSETSESFILRREGKEAVYLSELKFQKNSALNLKVPLDNKNVVAVQAALGHEGVLKGKGYRGTGVIAFVKKVPDSPWFLVTQIEDREALFPLKDRRLETVLLFFSLALLAGMGIWIFWRNQRAQILKERIKSADALRESEERFRALFEKAPLSYESLDDQGNFIDINDTWLETFGYERDEVIGKWFGDFLVPEEVEVFKKQFPIFKETGKQQSEFKLVHKNGTIIDVFFIGRIARDSDGNFIQTHGILQNVTLIKKSELQREVTHEITKSATTSDNLADLLKLIHQSLGKVFYVKNFFVALHDENTGLFSFPYWVDEFDPTPEPEAMKKSLSSYVFRTGKPILFSPELFQQLKEQNEVELVGSPSPSWIGVPLRTPTGTIGVLVLQHYEMENVYSERDVQFLFSVGSQIAMAIERKQAEEELRSERLLLRTVIDNIPDSIYCKDTASRKTLANLTNFRNVGLKSEAEILGKTDFDFHPREHAEEFYADDQLVLQSGQPLLNKEEYLVLGNGEMKWQLTSKLPLKDKHGNIIGLVGIGHDITERRMAQEALRESEIKLNVILQSTADGILAVDANGKVIKTNKRFAELWRVPQALIDSGDDQALIGFVLDQLTIPEEFISKVQKLYHSTVEDLDNLHFKDGRVFERFSAPLVMDDSSIGRVWSFRDITERKQAEEALQKSEDAYRALFYESKDAMMTLTPDEGFLSGNPETIRMFGCTDEIDFISRTPAEMSPEYQPDGALSSDKADEMMMLALNSGVKFFEWTHKSLDGTEFPATVLLSRIEKDGKVFLQATVRNITELKQAEQEIKLKNEELSKINSEKDKFFSIIAHDLRGPFNGFLGLTQIMTEELDTLSKEELLNMASCLEKSASTLFRLLENLLQWARMQQGSTPFNPIGMQLLTVVDESIAVVLDQAKIKGIDITVDISADLSIFADNNMLQTIIRNLVSNALKFTYKGGKVTISASTGDDNKVVVAIKDTGIGMSSEMVDTLFRLDVQNGRPGTDGEACSGLGLLLCKEFVEKHGCQIWMESEVEKGSTFYFSIPLNARR
jgi:PAS domain S-box-containing protein